MEKSATWHNTEYVFPEIRVLYKNSGDKTEYPGQNKSDGYTEEHGWPETGVEKSIPEITGFKPVTRGEHKSNDTIDQNKGN